MRRQLFIALVLIAGCSTAYGTSTAPPDAGDGAADAGLVDAASDALVPPPEAGTEASTRSALLTVKRDGAGNGVVRSDDLAIDCGTACTQAYGEGASVTLSATALADATFTGWSAPCGGTGKCTVRLASDVTVTASFALTVLDIDGNRAYDAQTDGQLVSRYLFGVTGPALTDRAVGQGATRASADAILAYLNGIRPQLDIDGDGRMDALTDGILVERYLSGQRGDALTTGVTGSQATRNTGQIEAYLATLTPPL